MTQPVLRLHSYWRSSSSYRVRIALAYKHLHYEYVAVDLRNGREQQHAPQFALQNPLQQVPVLQIVTGSEITHLAQSVAILEFLEEAIDAPALLPEQPRARAQVREAVEVVNSGIQPLHNLSLLNALDELHPDFPKQTWLERFIGRGLTALESLARERAGRYSVGDSPSLADLYLVPQLYVARRFHVSLEDFPTLLAVEATCLQLDAFKVAIPELQPDAPRD